MSNFMNILEAVKKEDKTKLVDKIKKLCTCKGGTSIDYEDHEKGCPALKILNHLWSL